MGGCMIARATVRSRWWLAVAVVAVVLLFVLGAQPFAVGIVPPPFDKLAHALVFGAMLLVLDCALVLPLWLAMLVTLLLSVADELHQLWLPGRVPGVADWLAGAVGVLVVAGWRLFRRR